jgi:hypothetical protein
MLSEPCVGAIQTVHDFLDAVSRRATEMYGVSVSKPQYRFLLLSLSTMLMQGQLTFTSIAKQSLGLLTAGALSNMFCNSKMPLEQLVKAAVCLLFEIYQPKRACLGIDDTDRARCKVVKALGFVFRTICKVTGGYILAQNIVFVCIITDRFTIPIAFGFFLPDPELKKWENEIKRLKKANVPKKDRPKKPDRDPAYPTRIMMCDQLLTDAMSVLREVQVHLGKTKLPSAPLKIHAVIADAAYMSPEMCQTVRRILGVGVNFISQLKMNQKCVVGGKEKSLQTYFDSVTKLRSKFEIRGKSTQAEWASARLFIKSHGKRLHVIAFRYAGEKDWRYLAAMDLTWRTQDIIQAYGLRWLVETFNEDWKQYGGWGRKAFQHGEEGCHRGVILSLLLDYFYLWHPSQVRLHRSGQPLSTVGSLVERTQIEYVITAIEAALDKPDPREYVRQIKDSVDKLFELRASKKHCAGGAGFAYPEIEPSPALVRRFGPEATALSRAG